MTYPNYRIASAFNFDSDAAALRTMVHEFGHLFGAPDHYNEGDVPSSDELGLNYSENCIYGEQRNSDVVTDSLPICPGCSDSIFDTASKYTP